MHLTITLPIKQRETEASSVTLPLILQPNGFSYLSLDHFNSGSTASDERECFPISQLNDYKIRNKQTNKQKHQNILELTPNISYLNFAIGVV